MIYEHEHTPVCTTNAMLPQNTSLIYFLAENLEEKYKILYLNEYILVLMLRKINILTKILKNNDEKKCF